MNVLRLKITQLLTRNAEHAYRRLDYKSNLKTIININPRSIGSINVRQFESERIVKNNNVYFIGQSPKSPSITFKSMDSDKTGSKDRSSSKWKEHAGIFICSLGVVLFCHDKVRRGGLLETIHAATPNITKHNFIADVVTKAAPAVVFLEIKGIHPDSGKRVTMSNGSGFLVRENGLILTSAHVVTNKSKVTVKLHGGKVYEGKVTAVDPVHDLATVKIDAEKKFPTIPLGKSSAIRPGEFVVAMGSPLSLNNTVTSGIVSSSLRGSKELGLNKKDMQYIQTDAVISFGNSGGPLVNLDGKAIGINNLKVTTGISFAIPADYAISFIKEAERLEEKSRTRPSYIPNGTESTKRRYMGISMLTLTPLIIMELKDRLADFPEVENGVYIHRVIVGSPAYERRRLTEDNIKGLVFLYYRPKKGGLHAGDIIVDINGEKIQSTADVYEAVDNADNLKITLIRGDNFRHFNVTTEELF